MNTPAGIHETRDAEHLRLLHVFHYVLASIYAVMACLPFLHFFVGYMLVFSPDTLTGGQNEEVPVFVGYLFMGLAGAFILLGWLFAALTAWSGWYIQKRKKRVFSMVIGGLNCLSMPFGTILGVFTIVVLERSSVRDLYDRTEM